MIWLVFGCVVLVMIGAGTLISRLAGISEKDRGKKIVDLGSTYHNCAYRRTAAVVRHNCQIYSLRRSSSGLRSLSGVVASPVMFEPLSIPRRDFFLLLMFPMPSCRHQRHTERRLFRQLPRESTKHPRRALESLSSPPAFEHLILDAHGPECRS